MTTQSDNSAAPPSPIASRGALVAVLGVALASGYFLAWGLGNVRAWNLRVDRLGLIESAGLACIASLVGILAGLAILWSPHARSSRQLAIRVLAAGSTRMMLALTLAVAFLIILKPEGYTFFTALTVACMGSLLGEVAWAIAALRRAAGTNHRTPMHTGVSAR